VTLRGIGCASIPRGDLQNRAHFVVWSRYFAALGSAYDLWSNAGWRTAGKQLLTEEFSAIAKGDRRALVRVLVDLPQALAFSECTLALAQVLRTRDLVTLRALLKEANVRKALRPNPRAAEAAAQVKEALNVQTFRSTFGKLRPGALEPSFRSAIVSVAGAEPETDTNARRLSESAQNAIDRESTLFRVEPDYGPCPAHAEDADDLLPDFGGDRSSRDLDSPSISDPETVPSRRGRRRSVKTHLHLIGGLDG
jgi:hypothetical protein